MSFSPPLNAVAGKHAAHAFADGLQRVLPASVQDHQKFVSIPLSNEIGDPNRRFQGSGDQAQQARSGIGPKAAAKLIESLQAQLKYGNRNAEFGKCCQGFAQVRLHHDAAGNAGDFVDAARMIFALAAVIAAQYRLLFFERCDCSDNRTVSITHRSRARVHGNLVPILVEYERQRFDRLRSFHCLRQRTIFVAPLTILMIAMQQRLPNARMTDDFMPSSAGNSFRTVAPKNYAFLQIDHTQADGQALENAVVNIGIVKSTHDLARRMHPLMSFIGTIGTALRPRC